MKLKRQIHWEAFSFTAALYCSVTALLGDLVEGPTQKVIAFLAAGMLLLCVTILLSWRSQNQ